MVDKEQDLCTAIASGSTSVGITRAITCLMTRVEWFSSKFLSERQEAASRQCANVLDLRKDGLLKFSW